MSHFENLVAPENLVKYGFISFLPFEGDIVQKDYSKKRARDDANPEDKGLDSPFVKSLRTCLRASNTPPIIEGGDAAFSFPETNAHFVIGSSLNNPFFATRGTQGLVQSSDFFYAPNQAYAHVSYSGTSPNHLHKLVECLARVVTPDVMQNWASWSTNRQYTEGVNMILMGAALMVNSLGSVTHFYTLGEEVHKEKERMNRTLAEKEARIDFEMQNRWRVEEELRTTQERLFMMESERQRGFEFEYQRSMAAVEAFKNSPELARIKASEFKGGFRACQKVLEERYPGIDLSWVEDPDRKSGSSRLTAMIPFHANACAGSSTNGVAGDIGALVAEDYVGGTTEEDIING